MRNCLVTLIATVLLLSGAAARADRRVALVVGNSAYQNVSHLANPTNDAKLMADTLRGLGFTLVGGGAQLNLDKPGIDRAVQAFGAQLRGADVGLFYYAGHGVQVRGANYLVPVEANPTTEADVDFQLLDTALVLHQMESAGTKLNLVILDACRNNPFGGRGLRAASGGLAQMQAPQGTLISFATQPGNVALDGQDGDSPYTRALAQIMPHPGLDIFQTFNQVGLAVMQATGSAQQPWVSSSPIGGSFYFAAPPVAAPPPVAADEVLWTTIKDSKVAALFEEFLRRFPSSPHASEAKVRLDDLNKSQVAVVAPPAVPPPAVPPPTAPKPAVVAPPVAPPSAPAIGQVSWTAAAADVAAWRLKTTTRLGGALAQAAVSLDRASVAVTAHREGSLHVVDALTLKPRAKITLSSYEAYTLGGIALLADGKRVATVRNGVLEVYDIDSRTLVQSIPSERGYNGGDVSLSKDGQRLYFIRSSINTQRSTVAVYRVASDKLTLETEYPFDVRVDSFDVTADGGRFLLGTYPDNALVLYDTRTKQIIWTQKCQCGGKLGAQDRLVVFAGRPGASAGNWDKSSVIGVLDIAQPERRAVYDTRTTESLDVTDVSPDGALTAVGSTNNGQVAIVPVSLDVPNLHPLVVLKDNSGQSVAGANFVGRDSLVTMSGDNNARLWKR